MAISAPTFSAFPTPIGESASQFEKSQEVPSFAVDFAASRERTLCEEGIRRGGDEYSHLYL